jgi:hypothetical protein
VTVDERSPVTRDMLDDADDAGRRHAVEHRAAERGDLHRLRPERAISNDVARAFLPDVEKRKRIHVDPGRAEHERDRPSVRASSLDRRRGRGPIQIGEPLGRGKDGPFGRLHTCDPSAFLIDQDRNVGPAGKVAKRVRKPQQLFAAPAIPLEQDEAGRIGVAKEGALVCCEL